MCKNLSKVHHSELDLRLIEVVEVGRGENNQFPEETSIIIVFIITQQSFRNGNSEQKNVKVNRKSVSVLALCNNLLSEQMWRMDTIVSFWLLKTIWNQPGKWCRKTFDKHENQLWERKRLLTSHGWTFALGLQYFSTFQLVHSVIDICIIFNFWLNMNHFWNIWHWEWFVGKTVSVC